MAEAGLLKILSQLGIPPAIVGLIVSGFVWHLTKRLRDDIQGHQDALDERKKEIEDLREKINNVEKDSLQRYVSRDDYLVWMQRIEARLASLQEKKNKEE